MYIYGETDRYTPHLEPHFARGGEHDSLCGGGKDGGRGGRDDGAVLGHADEVGGGELLNVRLKKRRRKEKGGRKTVGLYKILPSPILYGIWNKTIVPSLGTMVKFEVENSSM